MTDVGTTPRKPLTRLQRLALFEAFGGKCALCGQPIRGKWIDEHLRALGLGGTNEWDNRAPACEPCAKEKTKDDISRIAKAKRQKMHHLGIRNEKRRRIPSPPKAPKRPTRQLPPRRQLYEDMQQ